MNPDFRKPTKGSHIFVGLALKTTADDGSRLPEPIPGVNIELIRKKGKSIIYFADRGEIERIQKYLSTSLMYMGLYDHNKETRKRNGNQ